MVVMDFKVDNFLAFKNFHMNMSYPKKIVDSHIEGEFLRKRENFRYKKVNILMGGNATGKTSIGKMLMGAFNFMVKKEPSIVTKLICDEKRLAYFQIDFIPEEYVLYRVSVKIYPNEQRQYSSSDIEVSVRHEKILSRDSYESCLRRLEEQAEETGKNYVECLEEINGLSWLFQYPMDSLENKSKYKTRNSKRYQQILMLTLQALDPSIVSVKKVKEAENTYIIKANDYEVVMQDGVLTKEQLLSSGTKAGIEVAAMLTSMMNDEHGFYYCDEKFSYIHSDIEKAFLIMMISLLRSDNQLFFTTHNTDILDIPLPMHSFTFLQRDYDDLEQPIKCISASQYLKRNTDSLRTAFENDLFLAAPNVDMIYKIADLQ